MKRPLPDFIIKLDLDDTDRFIDALTESLCHGWTRARDIPAQPDCPAIYRFIRERPDAKTAAISLQRTDSETIQMVRFVARVHPMSHEEVVALLEEFRSCILSKVQQAGIDFTTLVCPELHFEQLMDAKALELLNRFAAHADKDAPLDEWEDRDRFQHFLIRLHRAGHRLTKEIIYLWATEEQSFAHPQAVMVALEFQFGLQCLSLYDRYLAYREECAPDLP